MTKQSSTAISAQQLPFYERLKEVAQVRFGRLRTVKQFYTLFTRSGLERFAGQRGAGRFSHCFCGALSARAADKLMMALAERIRSGNVTGRVMEPGAFPDYLSMTTSEACGVGFFTTEHFPLQDGFCSVQITGAHPVPGFPWMADPSAGQ